LIKTVIKNKLINLILKAEVLSFDLEFTGINCEERTNYDYPPEVFDKVILYKTYLFIKL